MVNVATLEQVADIFTKPFAEKGKWHHALKLINHLDVPKPPWLNKKGKDSDAHIVAKPQVLATLLSGQSSKRYPKTTKGTCVK